MAKPPPLRRPAGQPRPRFSSHEAPTKPARNDNASRWAAIAELLPGLDVEALAILNAVSAALAPLEPPDLLLRYDAVDERRKRVIAAVVHALAAPS